MFTDVVPALERLAAAGVPVLLCSSTRTPLVREFCERYGLLHRFAKVDGWGPGHTKSMQLVSGITAAGFAGHEVVFVGDTRRDADVARDLGAAAHQPAYPGDRPDRGDRAVGELDVPMDLGAGAERSDGARTTASWVNTTATRPSSRPANSLSSSGIGT